MHSSQVKRESGIAGIAEKLQEKLDEKEESHKQVWWGQEVLLGDSRLGDGSRASQVPASIP